MSDQPPQRTTCIVLFANFYAGGGFVTGLGVRYQQEKRAPCLFQPGSGSTPCHPAGSAIVLFERLSCATTALENFVQIVSGPFAPRSQ